MAKWRLQGPYSQGNLYTWLSIALVESFISWKKKKRKKSGEEEEEDEEKGKQV